MPLRSASGVVALGERERRIIGERSPPAGYVDARARSAPGGSLESNDTGAPGDTDDEIFASVAARAGSDDNFTFQEHMNQMNRA